MATPNFCAWEAVKEQVASNLHVAATELAAAWDNICSHSARRAAAELRSVLILKGYTPSQVAAWSDAYTYSLQLATFFALTSGSALASYDTKTIEWMDCRKEMRESQAIIIGDVATAPTVGEIGGVVSGRLDAVVDAIDPDDVNSGDWGLNTHWNW